MKLRPGKERGYFEIDWLKSHHSFSFGDYYDPKNMGYSDLRVLNHDFVAPSSGFPTHPHRDMEIISYVLNGVIEHRDSMGNKARINAGEIQVMSAGRGVQHSEYNPDPNHTFELIQIWILPDKAGLAPGYTQKEFKKTDRKNRWQLLVSPTAEDGSLKIHQDAKIWATTLDNKAALDRQLDPDRKYWLQVADGKIQLQSLSGEFQLEKGDALAITENEVKNFKITAQAESDLLLFSLRP